MFTSWESPTQILLKFYGREVQSLSQLDNSLKDGEVAAQKTRNGDLG